MRFAALGSGSSGNAWVVRAGTTTVLVDCGFGPRETARRLQRLGLEAGSIAAVVVTHEHVDHVGGAMACARRFGWSVHLTAGTRAAMRDTAPAGQLREIMPEQAFSIGDVEIMPCTVPHDAREPVQFVLGNGAVRLGILTDAGHVSAHMRESFGQCDALVLECNHDAHLLASGRYPPALKARIAGGWGHLENEAAAGLLAAMPRPSRLQHVIAAHLSTENNRPELARAALARALACDADWIGVADQDAGLDWREVI